MEWLSRLFVTTCLLVGGSFIRVKTAVPHPPSNLTLIELLADAVVVMWDADVSEKITLFEMTVRSLTDSLRIVKAHLDGRSRSYLVQSLYPETEYELFISAHNPDGMSNVSDVITFRTPQVTSGEYLVQPDIHPGEVMIVGLILVAWCCAIAVFLHKWGKLRILHSDPPGYNHRPPKNIETIKVVKDSSESVIHNSYSTEVTKTMVARQKRIERMNTMPNIKINLKEKLSSVYASGGETKAKDTKNQDSSRVKADNKSKPKVLSRRITSPVFELSESTNTPRIQQPEKRGVISPVLEMDETQISSA